MKEKSWWKFLGSYDGVGDGHCAEIHLVKKMLGENSFPTFYSFICSINLGVRRISSRPRTEGRSYYLLERTTNTCWGLVSLQ
jgi:hypothetical protein